MKTCGIIILAAGSSSRLGEAKQLLQFNHKSLLKHVLDEAADMEDAYTILVLGAVQESIQTELSDSKAIVCYNSNWQAGLSGSIHAGLKKLLDLEPEVDCCIIAVCDQPYISSQVFQALLEKFHNSNAGIVASSYANTAGTPALFSQRHFNDLLQLSGDEGAKKLLKTFEQELLLVPFERGDIDIDTPADYQKLRAES
jgi:molybdenum cofactor cytidylyltransferase